MDKLNLIGGFDPHRTPLTANDQTFPYISKFGIGKYLIEERRSSNREEFENFRSFDSFKHFKCGWVLELRGRGFPQDYYLVTGRVRHSQSIQATPLKPFVICRKSEEVIGAHCDCVVGLGQCCVHVGAILWALESHCQSLPETVTDRLAYWPAPAGAGRRNIETMARCENIEFRLPDAPFSQRQMLIRSVPEPSQSEVEGFLKDLYESGISAAILDVTPPYSGSMDRGRLDALYVASHRLKSLGELVCIKSQLDLQMSQEECDRIERTTRNQSASHIWFRFRTGRITASNFKKACRTPLDNPAPSLLRTICRPVKFRPTTAMQYGCDHEGDAIAAFKAKVTEEHAGIVINSNGFFIDPQYPCFGASPDAMVDCPCHGKAVVEAKCPYCAKDLDVATYAALRRSCLIEDGDGSLHLDPNHEYFYQIQMQMAITKCSMGYFVIWTREDLFVDTVYYDHSFWLEHSQRAQAFWDQCVLPELLCRHYTSPPETVFTGDSLAEVPIPIQGDASSSRATLPICVCQEEIADEEAPILVQCRSGNCAFRGFHPNCIGLPDIPLAPWTCPFCDEDSVMFIVPRT